MKKNLLLLSSIIFTATLGQAAWAAELHCTGERELTRCLTEHTDLVIEDETYELNITHRIRCFIMPPEDEVYQGRTYEAWGMHVLTNEDNSLLGYLSLPTREEHYSLILKGSRRQLTCKKGNDL